MLSRRILLAAVASVLALALAGCTSTGPVGRLYVLSDTALSVIERSKPRFVSIPSGLRLPTLSPTGSHLAGVIGDQLVLMDTTKTEPPATPLTAAAQASLIAWSPGGDRLAMVDQQTITIVDTHGKKGPVLSGFDRDIRSVVWSPDGQHLAVETGSAEVTDRTVWLADVAAGRAGIAAKNAALPAWAPDSKSLVFALWNERPESRFALLPLGGEAKVLVSSESLSAVRPDLSALFSKNTLQANWAGWSPKGDILALTFKAAGGDPRYVALTVSPQGQLLSAWILPVFPETQPYMTPPLPCAVGPMVWTPNQERLVASLGNPGCKGTVAILEAKTLQKAGELSSVPLSNALVSPDGAWVALRSPDGNRLEITNLADSTQTVSLPVTGELLLWTNR